MTEVTSQMEVVGPGEERRWWLPSVYRGRSRCQVLCLPYQATGCADKRRPAYCAMTVISLLGLPLALPQDSPARRSGLQNFTDGLSEFLSRCTKTLYSIVPRLMVCRRSNVRGGHLRCSPDRGSRCLCFLCACVSEHSRTSTRNHTTVSNLNLSLLYRE